MTDFSIGEIVAGITAIVGALAAFAGVCVKALFSFIEYQAKHQIEGFQALEAARTLFTEELQYPFAPKQLVEIYKRPSLKLFSLDSQGTGKGRIDVF